jgi:amino acid permease
MKGKWRISIIFGLIAFICTFFFSLMNNTWQTSLFRAGIGLILFFIIGYITLIVIQQFSQKKFSLPIDTKVKGEGITERDQVSKLETDVAETDFQAIPLQALHNGEKSKHSD